MTMQIIACPGQGSQAAGFLDTWLSEVEGFRAVMEKLSLASDLDLVGLGTTADDAKIKDTAIAQPLIVASSIATYRTLFRDSPVAGVLGHSVGEFAAAAIAGVISDEEAIRLVAIRARAMAKAAAEHPTSMAAILGGDPTEVMLAVGALGLEIANHNGAGQLVAAGDQSKIAALIASPPAKTRVIVLKVAGAFHTSYMDSARLELAEAVAQIAVTDPIMKLWSNVDGQLCDSGQIFIDSLVSQVTAPVRWDLCMANLPEEQLDFVELPPAGALTGLVKRAVPNANPIALKVPTDFEKVTK
ncbi:MAG: ACP S-malonyltransferase [Aquiluna sp.]|jgi:[acyl-carrier-protein] S-malonyltransferase|tara:strand:- start:15403 stop:16302 length:900 start_codon:yes stop_codon:yes gene_type:complete